VDAPQEVMTVDEAARYLRIPRSSIYKLAQEGRIPCKKVGRQWRFSYRALDEWLRRPAGAAPELDAAVGWQERGEG